MTTTIAPRLALLSLCALASCAASNSPGGKHPGSTPDSTTEESIVSDGIERHYRLHLPNDVSNRVFPVVFAFHGRGESAKKIEAYSQIGNLPVIAVFPEGLPGKDSSNKRSWQGAPYSAPVDDVQFVRDLLDHLEATLHVDATRVYATGKSNGGGFAALLACRMADRIAAVAPVAGAYYPMVPDCQPSRPMPVLEFHGTGDPVIAYDGDAKKGVPPIPAWLSDWARRDGCTRGPDVFFRKADITEERWSGCRGGSVVEHVRIDGGGHTWPGSAIESGPGETTHTIDATALIWQFFGEHPL